MAFSHVFTAQIRPSTFAAGGGSTDPIDTRGCDLFVFVVAAAELSGPVCSDNQGNYYFQNLNKAAGVGIKNEICYSVGPDDHHAAPLNTSATHVFSLGGGTYAQTCIIMGFSGVNAGDPLDIDGAGHAEYVAPVFPDFGIAADEVTPSINGNLIITGCTTGGLDQAAVAFNPFGDNQTGYNAHGTAYFGNNASFIIQNPAATITPHWENWVLSGPMAASVAVFNVGEPPGPPVPGGAGDSDGWMDMPRWVAPSIATGSVNVAAGAPVTPPVVPPEPTYLITEDGDELATEFDDELTTED